MTQSHQTVSYLRGCLPNLQSKTEQPHTYKPIPEYNWRRIQICEKQLNQTINISFSVWLRPTIGSWCITKMLQSFCNLSRCRWRQILFNICSIRIIRTIEQLIKQVSFHWEYCLMWMPFKLSTMSQCWMYESIENESDMHSQMLHAMVWKICLNSQTQWNVK